MSIYFLGESYPYSICVALVYEVRIYSLARNVVYGVYLCSLGV